MKKMPKKNLNNMAKKTKKIDGISETYRTKIESDTSDYERRMIELINGDKPRNKDERELVKEIKQAEKEGKIIDVPSN